LLVESKTVNGLEKQLLLLLENLAHELVFDLALLQLGLEFVLGVFAHEHLLVFEVLHLLLEVLFFDGGALVDFGVDCHEFVEHFAVVLVGFLLLHLLLLGQLGLAHDVADLGFVEVDLDVMFLLDFVFSDFLLLLVVFGVAQVLKVVFTGLIHGFLLLDITFDLRLDLVLEFVCGLLLLEFLGLALVQDFLEVDDSLPLLGFELLLAFDVLVFEPK